VKKGWKIALIALAALLVLVLVGPFLVPVAPLEGMVPVRELAGPEGDFVEINGLDVYYQRRGQGDPTFILLHGFGASTFSWREVIDPLAEFGTVIAYDRPAFGLTERPLNWEGVNPYSQQGNLDLLLGLMDAFSIDRAILVGNSAGGTLATAFALAYPERVAALVEVDAAIYRTMPDSPILNWLLHTPQLDHLGPLIARRLAGRQGEEFIRSAWYDPSRLAADPAIMAGYRLPLRAENWDSALWAHTQASAAPDLAERLDQIVVPTLVITGDNDRIVPPENSRELAEDIPGASLVVLKDCGHLPHEECPIAFIESIDQFLTTHMEVFDE
jgi:pimeloyl-ACP methyl ester carboxylesterase